MAAIRLDIDKGNRGAARVQGMHDRARGLRRIKPIGIEGHDAEPGFGTLEGERQRAAVIGGEIEIITSPRHIEVRIGIETVDKAWALLAQIILDLEIGIEREGWRAAVLQLAAKFALQDSVRQIGDV